MPRFALHKKMYRVAFRIDYFNYLYIIETKKKVERSLGYPVTLSELTRAQFICHMADRRRQSCAHKCIVHLFKTGHVLPFKTRKWKKARRKTKRVY